MKKLLRALFLSFATLAQSIIAQIPTQEQCQQADAELNQVYQQLQGSLNDAQKQQLKKAQRDWIKKRDAFVDSNRENPQGALYQATIQRVVELRGFIGVRPEQSNERGDQITEEHIKRTVLPILNESFRLMKQQDYKNAYLKGNQAYQISLKYAGEKHLLTLCAIQQIGRVFLYEGDIPNAHKTIEHAYKMFQKARGESDELTLGESTDYTSLLLKENNYQKAIEVGEDAANKWKAASLKENSDYGLILSNLGNAYFEQGYDYKKAAECFEKAVEIKMAVYGKNNDNYRAALFTLARCYYRLDKNSEAIEIDENLISNLDKYNINNPNQKFDIYSNLGACCNQIGQFDKAIEYYNTAQKIAVKICGDKSYENAVTMVNLAPALLPSKGVDGSKKELLKAKEVLEKIPTVPENIKDFYGKKITPILAMALEKKGKVITLNETIYEDLSGLEEDPAKSLEYANKAYNEVAGYEGSDSRGAVNALITLANANIANGDVAKARSIANQAFELNKSKFADRSDPFLFDLLAKSSYLSNDNKSSLGFLRQEIALQQEKLKNSFLLDEKSRITAAPGIDFRYDVKIIPVTELSETILQRKGIVMDSLLEDRSVAKSSQSNSGAKELLDKLNCLRSDSSKIAFSRKPEDVSNFKKLTDQIIAYEKGLAKVNSRSGRTRESLSIEVKQVMSSLSDSEVFLDFFEFYVPQIPPLKDTRFYGVILFSKNADPVLITISDPDLIDKSSQTLKSAILGGIEETFTQSQNTLTEKLVVPILAQLPNGTKRIMIAPYGKLNFLSFAILQLPQGMLFAEKYDVYYVASGRDLVKPAVSNTNHTALVFANPKFDLLAPNSDQVHTSTRSADMSQFNAVVLPPLPGTEYEALTIKPVLESSGWTETTYLGVDANKKKIMDSHKPGILHLATHGFYLNALSLSGSDERGMKVAQTAIDKTNSSSSLGIDPMRASGVALTGAQSTLKAWSEGKSPDPDQDGVLTAEEVAGLDLNGTWLVTLSACDTGVGEAKSGEGVFGLRRAFMMAGAQNLLMTLWPVSDEVTAKIMADFYKEALATHDAPGALSKVQRDWLVKLRKEKGLLADVRDAGPFAMVVMANPNAKPMPEFSPTSSTQPLPETTSSKVSTGDSAAPVSIVPTLDSRDKAFGDLFEATLLVGQKTPEGGNIMEFNDALSKADAGDCKAQAIVSIYYALGYKTEKDLGKAAEYASKSEAQNNPLGQYQLGVLTAGGDGIEKDAERGKELKVQSIEGLNTMADDPYALAALGAMALRGEGVAKDMKKAAKLYRKSADLGYAPAQILYSMMLTKGVGVSPDASSARKYASMADAQNYHP
jgi:CHAT domain-containing protein